MAYKTTAELKQALLEKSKNALIIFQAKVDEVINRYIKEYYAEYTPAEYIRTYQLYRSIVKSAVEPTGNGFRCSVYLDVDGLNYSLHQTRSMGDRRQSGEEANIVEGSIHGFHGGPPAPHGTKKIYGTDIYGESMEWLDANAIDGLKRAFREAGIPVK